MAKISRRSFIESAVAIGATAAWRLASPKTTKILWREQREFFPEGVASGDPDSSSVLLWTRHTSGRRRHFAPAHAQPDAETRGAFVPCICGEWRHREGSCGFQPDALAASVDMGGHGYSVVRASSTSFETEFVCIPRPLERSSSADGGPLRYRVRCRTELWKAGEPPRIEASLREGDPRFSMD
jgi:hypothetical protein